MHRFVLIGSSTPIVAFAASTDFSDGWPSGPQAILLEIVGVALLGLVLKHLFDAFHRPRGA